MRGDEAASGEVIEHAATEGWSLVRIYAQILTPSHTELERLVLEGAVDRGHEKFAVQITLAHMERLRSQLHTQTGGRRIMVAVVDRGEHSLEALMMADVFRADGATVDYLGSFVPFKDLQKLLQERAPDLLALPVTSKTRVRTIERIAKAMQGLAHPRAVLLHGAAFAEQAGPQFENSGVRVARNLEEALSKARESLFGGESNGGLTNFLHDLGARIRAARRRSSLTQQQLAEKASLDRTYIVAVERGRQNVTVGAVLRIAEALRVPIDRLLVSDREAANEA